MSEAGGKHYGDGCTPWHLQRSMTSWGSVFLDARRTDVIEYVFRVKGDRSKQLDDARKALHNLQEIVKELEEELGIEPKEDTSWKNHVKVHVGPIRKIVNGHVLRLPSDCNCENPFCNICIGGLGQCLYCNAAESELDEPCKVSAGPPKTHVGDDLIMFHPTHKVENDHCVYCNKYNPALLKAPCIVNGSIT